MAQDVDFYRTHSRWTDPGRWSGALAEIPAVPPEVVRAVSGLLLHPFVAPMRSVAIPSAALDDRGVRSVEGILDRVRSRDASTLTVPRGPEQRVFCVCAGFARVATAVFRTHGVPARCRFGFAAYLNRGFLEDHSVCEYWDGAGWRLLDAQLDDAAIRENRIPFAPSDVPREEFLDGSTAWVRLRAGELDATKIGLSLLGLTGAWFVAGSLMLDVAALNKEELLPWEKWSVGRELGPGAEVPRRWAEELDAVAALLRGAPDAALAGRVYGEKAWLRVTPTVLTFVDGAPRDIALAT